MPVSKAVATGKKPLKAKSLKVVELIRDGGFFWQTDVKIPETMQNKLGWKEVDTGIFEVERPRQAKLADFGHEIEGFGFKIKRIERQEVVASPTLKDEEKTEGETKLHDYLEAKDEAATAKTASEAARDILKDWMVGNAAPKDPAHPDARLAQIGGYKVHNSWVKGRETKWDDRDHKPIGDWAIEEGCAEEMVKVILHKTISFDDYKVEGVPEGFEGSISIDPDVYEYYSRIGAVPKDINDAFEGRGRGYYGVKVYETKELSCTSCGMTVKKTQKFCGECGQPQN
jgi:hypothetical protein